MYSSVEKQYTTADTVSQWAFAVAIIAAALSLVILVANYASVSAIIATGATDPYDVGVVLGTMLRTMLEWMAAISVASVSAGIGLLTHALSRK